MINLKTICFLLILSFIFINCSAAQEKPSLELPAKTNESSDRVNPDTKKFESNAGNFSINISQLPTQIRNLEPDKGRDPGKQLLWQFEKTVYTVLYSAVDKNNLSHAFDEMNSGVLKGIGRQGGQLISEKEISFGKYPGKEIRWIAADGVTVIGRNYLVNDMGYLVTAGFVDGKSEKEALEVLDSFKLLTEKK
ncbi:MAG: hypothetical protein M3033_11985 [Acidobacteriota bacterium]|nr:hypothetical protein [Acidobacteriota bacterium]